MARRQNVAKSRQKNTQNNIKSKVKKAAGTAKNTAKKTAKKTAQSASKVAGKKPSKSTAKSASKNAEKAPVSSTTPSRRRKRPVKKKKKLRVGRLILLIMAALAIVAIGYTTVVIATAPSIDTSDIYSYIDVNSTLYDDEGKEVSSVFSGEDRSIIKYDEIPENMINAIVAIEDKTFWDHHGFNFTRMLGAIKDAVFGGGGISGTSTITQQLARNVYLADIKSERSIKRKIVEAYYTVKLESNLSKEEIIEAYLNSVYFGNGNYGIKAAAENYFSKDVKDLNLAQCAALAALPQSPSIYELVTSINNAKLKPNYIIIYKGAVNSYVLNDVSKDRRHLTLDLMKDQGYISAKACKKAKKTPLSSIINANTKKLSGINNNYFGEYIINQVIKDLVAEYGYSSAEAYELVYTKGLKIYSTMDSTAQEVMADEFNNQDNFPGIQSYPTNSEGNIIDSNGAVALYSYYNMCGNDRFTFRDNEYKWNSDGSLTIYYGHRLNIYKTEVDGGIEYSLEFPKMFIRDEHYRFFVISGGYINIPKEYKSVDENNNLVISADFFNNENYAGFFDTDNGLSLPSSSYSLNQKIVQPQSAMVIRDVNNGQIKAMMGGREIVGEQVYNRATALRQPGSSIKPLAIYSASLQYSYDQVSDGKDSLKFINPGGTKQGEKYWGNFLTAASTVIDEKMKVDGKYWPQNSDKKFRGVISMREAIMKSINTCAVKIFQQIGPEVSSEQVQKFGITSLVTDESLPVNDMNAAALSLGGLTNGVSPLEMSNAYTAFVNGGKVYEGGCYTKVVDRSGNEILTKDYSKFNQAIDDGVAFIMRDMMFGVVEHGTGVNARLSEVKAGGKTGTTSNQYDIWFDGFTPSYAASLWIGNDMNMKLTSMSEYAARMWGRIMRQIPKANTGEYSEMPSDVHKVKVDARSGYLPSEGSKTKYEYFIIGTEPTSSEKVDFMTEEERKKKEEEEAKKKAEEEAKKKAEEEAKQQEEITDDEETPDDEADVQEDKNKDSKNKQKDQTKDKDKKKTN
ncbi:MAG: transglycosylase domain-containing protein [Clostridia bacterium]|nr:transglycosylase domain-containing protein [Clostridia bacterium]